MIFTIIPFALATLIAGILFYYHVDGLIAILAAILTFLGVLFWELKEYRRWLDEHTPGI